jgi:hypothetical protein
VKKGCVIVAVVVVTLMFMATGAASGQAVVWTHGPSTFTQESEVSGTGLVMVNKDVNTFPNCYTENLATRLHVHGVGEYEACQDLSAINEGNLAGKTQEITLKEEAMMIYEPQTLTVGSMTLIDEETSPKWKEALCIKNYQIGTAMTEMYTNADYIEKCTESKVKCVEPKLGPEDCEGAKEDIDGYGLACLSIESKVDGAAHIGAVVKDTGDQRTTIIKISEDYIGNFTICKKMTMNETKDTSDVDKKTWLECPWGWPCKGDC